MNPRRHPHPLAAAVLLCGLVAAPAWAQQPAPAPAPNDVVKLAAPGFQGTGVDEATLTFLTDHYAQQLVVNGVQVVTASQITALVGFERQKELLGCNENNSSCLAELGNALGVDGLVTGSVGKFGGTYQLNLKVLSAKSGQPIAVASERAYGDTGALDTLSRLARDQAKQLQKQLNKGVAAPGSVAVAGSTALPAAATPQAQLVQRPSFPYGSVLGGGALAALGGLFIYTGATTDWTEDGSSVEEAQTTEATAYVLGGALALGGGFLMYRGLHNYNKQKQAYETQGRVTVMVTPHGARLGLIGTF